MIDRLTPLKHHKFTASYIDIISIDNDSVNRSPYKTATQIRPFRAVPSDHMIDTGTWYMNRCDYLDPALAWTGVKNSGKGCTLSTLGYDQLTRPKSFHLKLQI